MRILVIEPKKRPYVKEIDGSNEALCKIIRGDLEIAVPFIDDDTVNLVCDEIGKIKRRPFNRVLKTETGEVNDVIAGTFCLFNTDKEGDKMVDLTDEQIQYYSEMFKDADSIVDELNCKHKIENIKDSQSLYSRNSNEPLVIFENHGKNFSKEKVKVLIFEPEKEPYAKEIVLTEEFIGLTVGWCLEFNYGKTSDKYVVISRVSSYELTMLARKIYDKEMIDKIRKCCKGTYMVCKVAKDKRGFVSFDEDEIESYIAKIEKDNSIK